MAHGSNGSSPSAAEKLQRACDRCAVLVGEPCAFDVLCPHLRLQKTQCDLTFPCGRCSRLGVECATKRPYARRGRPKKRKSAEPDLASIDGAVDVTNASTRTTQHVYEPAQEASRPTTQHRFHAGADSTVTSSSSPVDAILADHDRLPIDHQLAIFLLGRVLSSSQDQGFLELFTRNGHLFPDVARDGPFGLSTGNVLALISVSVEQHWPELPGHIRGDIDAIQNEFRNQTLASIPSLLEQTAQLLPQHLGTLLLLSHTWCFTYDLVALANRWNNLSLAEVQEMLDDKVAAHRCVFPDERSSSMS